MSFKLLKINPCQLRFAVELEKQSSCTIYLVNKSEHYVAFKVKTTSPKRYSVQPNISIVEPKSTSEFTVIMQARRVAPSDMQCKDKFLLQSTVVPSGTTEEDITPSTFTKGIDKYIEEIKLRVVLTSPDSSPELIRLIEDLKQDPAKEAPVLKDQISKDMEELRLAMEMQETKMAKDEKELSLANDVQEMKLKLHELESKLSEAEITITKLREHRSMSTEDTRAFQKELVMLRREKDARKVQVGFPFLFVCMVATIGVALGSIL